MPTHHVTQSLDTANKDANPTPTSTFTLSDRVP